MNEEEIIEQAYFKEYLCYQFKCGLDLTSAQQRQLAFNDTHNADTHTLPAALLDRLGGRETLYLLNWRQEQGQWALAVKELAAEKWINVKMNLLP